MTAALFQIPDHARRVIVAANPKAGARSGRPLVARLTQILRHKRFQVDVLTEQQELVEKARQAVELGELRAVVAAGGDGTVALVANNTPEKTPIMVLPLGTENLLSKHLGLDADPEEAARIIEGGVTIRLDAGRANGRLFLIMISCGFDAEVVHRLHRQRRGHIHHLSYLKPIIDSIRSYRYPELRIYCDELEAAQPALVARWAFVVNLPPYAIGLQIAPNASGEDGQLDLCTFKQGSLLNGLRYFAGVLLGWHRTWPDFCQRQARRLRIESDEPTPYQLDGDPGGMLPVDIEVLPHRLTLLAPLSFHGGKQLGEASENPFSNQRTKLES